MITCPKCKLAEVKEEVHYSGIILNRKKVITHYCVLCDWEKKVRFNINEDEYQKEMGKW